MTKVTATVAAVQAVLSALVLLSVVELTGEQLAGITTAVGALLLGVAAWFDASVPFGAPKGE